MPRKRKDQTAGEPGDTLLDFRDKDDREAGAVSDVGAYLQSLMRVPRLTNEEEKVLRLKIVGKRKSPGAAPLLTLAEEVKLGRCIRAAQERQDALQAPNRKTAKKRPDRGVVAKKVLVHYNTRLVVSIAKTYRNRGLPFEDLISEGNVGLLVAAEKYDPELGYRFSTYATWWIRQKIQRALEQDSQPVVYLPKQVLIFRAMRERAINQLMLDLRRAPNSQEIAAHIGLELNEFERLERATLPQNSLSIAMAPEEEFDAADAVESPEPSTQARATCELMREDVQEALKWLHPREREILRMRMGFDGPAMTLEQVGRALKITKERVRQLQMRGVKRLRQCPRWQFLAEYLLPERQSSARARVF